jgi:pimeloyl-ACP methyl ester carboxylesterase/DNA-binding CsgD family transcriptional regulator
MKTPTTCYAKSGGVHVAWQSVGRGERDVLFVPGWVSNVEANWDFPEIADFFNLLSRIGRLILFDKRGTGLSDRVSRMPTMEERMDDARAVLEAAGAKPAVVIGASEGSALAALFAATHPERTSGLVLYGGYARRSPAPDYPWAPTAEQRRAFMDAVVEQWGGPMDLTTLAPSRAGDAAFVERFAAYLRVSASPGAAHALARMNTFLDIRSALTRIRAPTLVLHRRGDRDCHCDEGRYVASKIPGARFVALEGEDHWPFVGDCGSILNEISRFVDGLPLPSPLRLPPATLRPVADVLDALTPKQREVLEFLAQGRSNKQIAALLNVSEHTVHRHVAEVLGRLGVSSRAAAAALYAERFSR